MLTSRALFCYAPGLLAFSLCKVFIPAFYALKDTSTPVRVSIWSILVSFSINVTGIVFLPLQYKHVGIVVGSVVGETINGVVLAWIFTRKIGSPGWVQIFGSISRIFFSAAVMGTGVWWLFYRVLHPAYVPGLHGTLSYGLALIGSVVFGMFLYVLSIVIVSKDEFMAVISALKRGKRPDSDVSVSGNGN